MSHQGAAGGHRKTGRSEIAQASLGAPKRRYEGVEKGPSVWKKEWSAFMTNIPMEKQGKGTKLSKSLDLAKAPRQRVVDGTLDDVASDEGGDMDDGEEGGGGYDYVVDQATAPSFSYLFASPAEKKAERDKRQREKEALKKKRAIQNARSGQAEFDGDSRSKMQREMDEAKMRGINLEVFANRKQKREALRITKSTSQVEAAETFKEDANKGVHERMVSKLPWYQQGPFPLDEIAEKLVTKKAVKKHARLRQMTAPPVAAADGTQPWHLRKKQNRAKRAREEAEAAAGEGSNDDYNNDEQEEEGHHLKVKHDHEDDEDEDEGGGVKGWKRMGSYNYLTVHPSWVAARGWKRMLEFKSIPVGTKTYFDDEGEPIHDGMFATSGWLYNKCNDGPKSEIVSGPEMPPSYYRNFAPFTADQIQSEKCAITARALGLRGVRTEAEDPAAAASSKKVSGADAPAAATVADGESVGFGSGVVEVVPKPLSAKYQRVADKKARDAAIAEAIAKGEEPPVFEKKPKVVPVETTPEDVVVAETPVTDAAKNEEGSDEEKEEVNTGTLDFVEVDEVLRKKAANAASALARRMSKKKGAKKVNFVQLIEGELKKLVKLAGGTDEAIANAVASERKHFAAIKAAKEAAAAEKTAADVASGVTTATTPAAPTMTRKEKNQRDYEERQRAKAALAGNTTTEAEEESGDDASGSDSGSAASSSDANEEEDDNSNNSSDNDSDEDGPASTTSKHSTASKQQQQTKPQNVNNKNIKKPQQQKKNTNKNKQPSNNNTKKAAPGAAGGKKKPKLDMRGLNKKQKKEKREREAEMAAKKAAPPVRAQVPLRRGGNHHDKPDPTSKRSERRKQRVMPEIVKGTLPATAYMSSDALAALKK